MCVMHIEEKSHCPRPHPCCPSGAARVRGLAQAWALLQLARCPAYGYELLERMADEPGAPGTDPGFLYRTLRALEEDGLVRSSWDTGGSGPARRMYAITDLGQEALDAWAAHFRRTQHQLARFLEDYTTLRSKGGEKGASPRKR